MYIYSYAKAGRLGLMVLSIKFWTLVETPSALSASYVNGATTIYVFGEAARNRQVED